VARVIRRLRTWRIRVRRRAKRDAIILECGSNRVGPRCSFEVTGDCAVALPATCPAADRMGSLDLSAFLRRSGGEMPRPSSRLLGIPLMGRRLVPSPDDFLGNGTPGTAGRLATRGDDPPPVCGRKLLLDVLPERGEVFLRGSALRKVKKYSPALPSTSPGLLCAECCSGTLPVDDHVPLCSGQQSGWVSCNRNCTPPLPRTGCPRFAGRPRPGT